MQDTVKTESVKLLPRKLPASSFEVIRLPTTLTPQTPPNKGYNDQQPRTKRRKITAPLKSQADKFQSKLKTKYPRFTKTLTKSQVSTYFALGIPESFCMDYLPSSDTCFLLEYESGKIHKVNYSSKRRALSGGWREFCLAENFSVGDVLSFRLVSPNKFKVGRVRKKSLREMTGKRITLNSDAIEEQNDVVTHEKNKETHQASQKCPSFTKTLLTSHLSEGSLMELPRAFCTMNLPTLDTFFLLENETGKRYVTNYLARKAAFIDGWREFCLAEKVAEGDVLIFKLVNPTKFKVRIIRTSRLSRVDEATLNLDFSVEPSAVAIPEENKETHRPSSLEAMSGADEDGNLTSEANEFLSNPNAVYPTFTRSLLKSHVSGCFWMGLPPTFCKMHLPLVDTWILLEYENGEQYKVKYLADRTALSGGWRAFSVASNLAEGDVLLFQLINLTKFKVQKIRSGLRDGDGERVIPSAGAINDGKSSDVETREENKETHQASLSETVCGDENHAMIRSEDENIQKVDIIKENNSSGDGEHVQSPPVINDHHGFTNFDDFIILLDDFLKKDNNLSDHFKRSYHQLCSSQKSLLHVDLDINPCMHAGCIIEIVDIANAMKNSQLTTFDANFSKWDRKLKSLELLGMNVKFLSARLLSLQRIATNSGSTRQKYNDLCSEHAEFENTIKSLQDKLDDLRRLSVKHADEIEKLKTEIKEDELKFREQDDQQLGRKRRKIMAPVMNKGDKCRPKLMSKHPGFTKTLMKTHVSEYFKLPMLQSFCKDYLPSSDTSILLENECGKTYITNYLSKRGALGGGWREFCLTEKLAEGDVLIFRLVSPNKFKVRKISKKSRSEMTGNRITLDSNARVEQTDTVTHQKNKETHQASSSKVKSGDKDLQKVTPSKTSQADKAKCPSFTKKLVKSHVSGSFWMALPQPFCRMHLPSADTYFILEYENGKEYKVKYLAKKAALSGGWKGCSRASKFAIGDVLLFQLVNSTNFKIQKIRSDLSDVNGDRVIQNVATREENEETHQASSSEADSEDENAAVISSEVETIPEVETIKTNTLEGSSGDAEHVHSPPSIDDHNGSTNIDDFLNKRYNLPHHVKRSYRQLCFSQKSALHVNLMKDINPGMAAGCIIETVDIANAIKSCELATFNTNFLTWDRKLKILELSGMNVKFLSARLQCLQRLASSSSITRQKYNDLCSVHSDRKNRIKSLQDELNNLIRLSGKDADDIEKLKTEIKEHELKFQEQVSSPW